MWSTVQPKNNARASTSFCVHLRVLAAQALLAPLLARALFLGRIVLPCAFLL